MKRILAWSREKLVGRTIGDLDRSALVWLRWLIALGLLFISLYATDNAQGETNRALFFVLIYAMSNLGLAALEWRGFSAQRWIGWVFVTDIAIVGTILYQSVGLDADLYLICFLILYLATLGRRVRDAIPLAIIGGLLYGVLVLHQHPNANFVDVKILIRFPFFLILAVFTTFLSEQTQNARVLVKELKFQSKRLEAERDGVVLQLQNKEAALIQAEKLSAMGHMAGALAHEIRNPLCVISGYAGDLASTLAPDDPLLKRMQIIDRCASRCMDLMNNLLRFSRTAHERETFSVLEALEEAAILASLGTKCKNIKMETECIKTLEFTGQRSEIQQIVLNLSTNAIDAMPDGGTIRIIARPTEGYGPKEMLLSVQDTGVGMTDEVQKKIFEPFYTTKAPGKGTGLGMSIVSDIVRKYHGSISVNSRVGKGTTILIRLLAQEPITPDGGNAAALQKHPISQAA